MYLFLFLLTIILFLNYEKVSEFAESIKSSLQINTLKNNTDDKNAVENKEKKPNETEEELIKSLDISSDEIRKNILLDSFNIQNFEDDTYILNFYDDSVMSNVNVVENGSFIFDAIGYLYRNIKWINFFQNDQSNKSALRNNNILKRDSAEIKKLIIVKLLKCLVVIAGLYIIFRLICSFFMKSLNFIIRIIFKIIKYCCCGGK